MARPRRKQVGPRHPQTVFMVALLAMAAAALFIWQAKKHQVVQDADAPPRLTGFIQDSADLIHRDERMALEQNLRTFDALGGPQVVVATLYTSDRPIEDEAIRLARSWKIGRAGANNGVLLLMLEREHQARIEVGYGLEGTLTDAQTRLIIANDMSPAMQSGDFTTAAQKGVAAILSVLHPGPLPAPPPDTMGLGTQLGIALFMLVAALICLGVVQAILLAIPVARNCIAASRYFGWFARVRILGGSRARDRGDDDTSTGSSTGAGGSFGGGGATG